MITVNKGSQVDGLSARFRRIERDRLFDVAIEVNPWLVIIEDFVVNLGVSGVKSQTCVVLLAQIRHHIQRSDEVSLSRRSEVGRQQGNLCAQIDSTDLNAPSEYSNQGLKVVRGRCVQ